MQRILVTRLRFLGDVVLTTPVLHALREAFPDARLEYLTSQEHSPVLQGHPCVDVLHTLPPKAGAKDTLRLARRLRSPRIDWWIDLFGNPRSVWLATLSRPRHSVGPRRGLRTWIYQHRRARPRGDRSAILHHLDKLTPLLGKVSPTPPSLHVSAAERADTFDRMGLARDERPVVLHPGSTWPDKAWPTRRWPELIGALRALPALASCPVLVVSPPGQEDLAREIVEASAPMARPVPPSTLRTMLGLLSGAGLYVGNDGGILHCAVALGVPSVGLFGPTEPDIWFPYEDLGPFRVVREYNAQGPCAIHGVDHVSALAHLATERVIEAVMDVVDVRAREASGA